MSSAELFGCWKGIPTGLESCLGESGSLSFVPTLELSREFWKVPSRLLWFKRTLSLSGCRLFWFLGNDPFYLRNDRLHTIPLLPSQREECLPLSMVCSEYLPFLSACLIPRITPKLPDLWRTHTQLHQKALWGEWVHQCTHNWSTWKSTLAVILLPCLILPLSGLLTRNCVLSLNLACYPFNLS